MSNDLKMMHNVTVKLEEALHEINKMLSDYLIDKKEPESHKPKHDKKEKKSHTENKKQEHKEHKDSKQSNERKLKRPLTAFFLFSNDQREVLRKSYPEMPITQISENLGKIWKNLPQQDKRPYIEKAQRNLQKFYQQHPQEKHKKKNKH